ncbi:MAG: ABC transporter permease subunit [Spirochaetaceae bacterium]|jgi:ABC-2 type transport system permease protein|nr:ABC transporter permease subunit [Spirochaetaceae bacterium]
MTDLGQYWDRTAAARALVRKELYSYGVSPFSYGITVFFLLFVSIWLFYVQRFFTLNTASLRPFFAAFPLGFVLVVPAITMKGWAEERKLGSIELLLTMPFSEWDLVMGKFVASFTVLACIIGLTIPVPLSLLPLGDFDGGTILGEYAGALLLGACATSLGLLLSSISRNQGGAFLGSSVMLLMMMFINQVTATVNLPPLLSEGINFFSLSFHFESFSKGIIDTRDVAFFLLTTVLWLFLTTRVLIVRKWR